MRVGEGGKVKEREESESVGVVRGGRMSGGVWRGCGGESERTRVRGRKGRSESMSGVRERRSVRGMRGSLTVGVDRGSQGIAVKD
jgi:hypothetical protein